MQHIFGLSLNNNYIELIKNHITINTEYIIKVRLKTKNYSRLEPDIDYFLIP